MLPDSLVQLGPYFAPPGDNSFNAVPIDASILQRYDLLHTGEIGKVPRDEPIIAERSAVDPQVDELLRVNVSDFNYASVGIIDNMAGRLRSWDRQDMKRIKPFLR